MCLRIYGIIFSAAVTDGAGKTRANVIALLYAVKRLQGKKDRAGDYARIIVAGYTLAHLNKTFLVYLRQVLDQSKTRYTENKKDNFFTIGTVTVFVVPMENPDTIFGLESAAIFGEEIDELTEDKAIEAIRALSERCRQQIPGERSPFLCFGAKTKILCRNVDTKSKLGFTVPQLCAISHVEIGDEVLTRQGWRKVVSKMMNGYQETISVRGVHITRDHQVWNASAKMWQEIGTIRDDEYLLSVSIRRIRKWQKLRDRVEEHRGVLSTLEGLDTTGGRITESRRGIIGRLLRTVKKLRRCMLLYGKPKMGRFREEWLSIIKILIQLITLLKILYVSRRMSTIPYTQAVNSTIGFALTVEKWLLRTGAENSDVTPVKRNEGRSKIRNETDLGRRGNTRGSGISRWRERLALTAEAFLQHEPNNVFGVHSAGVYAVMNRLGWLPRRSGGKPVSVGRKESASCAGNVLFLYEERLLSALKNVMTRLDLLTNLALEQSFSRMPYASFAERVIGNIKTGVSKLVRVRVKREKEPVYDITVAGEHEFFTDKFLVHNCFASTSQGTKGLYRIYNHFKKNGTGFVLVRGRTEDNPYLPASMIRDMKKMYSPAEKRVFMDGEFLAIAKGRVLGDFDWERNYLNYDMDQDLLPGETVYIGCDFNTGFNRASAYVVRDGVIYCIKCYDFPDPQDAPSVFRHGFPEQRILWIPDVTIKDSFPQFARELRKYGVQIIYRKKNPLVEDTVFLVNKLFYTGRLMVCKIAKDLAEACALFMRDKDNRVPKGIGPSSPAHYVDGTRYACSFICTRHKDFRDIRELVVNKRASFRSDSGKPVQDLGGGYSQIHPDALYYGKKL